MNIILVLCATYSYILIYMTRYRLREKRLDVLIALNTDWLFKENGRLKFVCLSSPNQKGASNSLHNA